MRSFYNQLSQNRTNLVSADVFSDRKTEVDIVFSFLFLLCVRMTEWIKEKTLSLIEQITSKVWDIEFKEYKGADIRNGIFEAKVIPSIAQK
jgi:hypothetical protein